MTPRGAVDRSKKSRARRAAVYVRLSRDRDGETSTARQERDARALATARGFKVTKVFSDVDLSAYKAGVVRPAYEQMLDAAAGGEIDAVIVWKVDRLARSVREFVRVTELLAEQGVALLSVNESLDTSSPMGRAMLQIIGVFAELESATISLRTKSAKEHNARSGLPNGGGRRPFGYTTASFTELVDDEAEILRECAGRLLDGASLRSIALDLNRRGIRTASGSTWTSSNLGRVLRSPHLAGIRRHRGQDVADGTWPAILTTEEHEQIVLAAGEHRDAKVRRHLLTGFARCGVCSSPLRAKTTKRFGFQYACGGCGGITVRGQMTEDLVGEAALQRLDSAELRRALDSVDDSAEMKAVADELAADREALEELSRDHYVRRVVSREVFLASASMLEERIAAAEGQLARRRPKMSVLSGDSPLRERWAAAVDDGDVDFRRQILATVVDTVTVMPTSVRGRNSFDAERVSVTWRV